MREPRYADKWLPLDRKPLNHLTVEEARQRHAARDEYAALIGPPDAPSHIVALVGPWVTVSFLDADRREYLLYSFKELRPGHIFLKQAIAREFAEESGELSVAMIFAFAENGKIIMEHQNRVTHEIEERRATVDPAPNWDRYPEFGVYDSLLHEERGDLRPRSMAGPAKKPTGKQKKSRPHSRGSR